MRKINFFEKTILVVGFGVLLVGLLMISNLYKMERELSWELYQAIFIWLVLIVTLVLAATTENVKEELSIIMAKLAQETGLLKEETRLMKQEIMILKEIQHKQLEELRLLRKKIR
jgi:uncharacterized membrane protein